MTTWDEQISQLRKQITELKSALDQNEKIVESNTSSVNELRAKVEKLLERVSNPRQTISQLVSLMQQMNHHKSIGSMLVSSDGKVLMQNFAAQKMHLGDAGTGQIPGGIFWTADAGRPVPETEL